MNSQIEENTLFSHPGFTETEMILMNRIDEMQRRIDEQNAKINGLTSRIGCLSREITLLRNLSIPMRDEDHHG